MHRTFKHFYLYTGTLLLISLLLMLLHNRNAISVQFVDIWLRQSAITGILSMGLTFINLCGNFDISTGAIMSLSAAACVCLLQFNALPLVLILLVVIVIAALCCLLNGFLSEWFHLPHFIVSIGTMMVYVGLVSLLTDGLPIWSTQRSLFHMFSSPLPAVLWFSLLVPSQFLLQSTYVGQYFYAIGDNEAALCAIGVNTRRYKLIACLLCGIFAGIAGICMMLRTSVAVASNNIDSVFQAITVLAMSGMYQKGARPNLFNVLLSTITLTCGMVCMTVYAINPTLQNVVIGMIFLGALVCSRVRIGELLKT